MPFPFPTYCPFDGNQQHLSLMHVARPATGQRGYTLPIGVRAGDSAEQVLQLQAAIYEAEAHLVTLKTQLWLREVGMQWQAHFPIIEQLRMNLTKGPIGKDEWRFQYWNDDDVYECNGRGYTRRLPWKDVDGFQPVERYRRERPIVETATEALRNLLQEFPKDALATFLVKHVFEKIPGDTGLTQLAWSGMALTTMPAALVQESRAVGLEECLPNESPPVLGMRF